MARDKRGSSGTRGNGEQAKTPPKPRRKLSTEGKLFIAAVVVALVALVLTLYRSEVEIEGITEPKSASKGSMKASEIFAMLKQLAKTAQKARDGGKLKETRPQILQYLNKADNLIAKFGTGEEVSRMKHVADVIRQLIDEVDVFGSENYWDSYYKNGGLDNEWFMDWSTQDNAGHSLQRLLTGMIPADAAGSSSRVLVIGCGHSDLGPELYRSGRQNVDNVDFSPTAISNMQAKHGEAMPGMRWGVADITRLEAFKDGAFDFVVDKGTLDALAENPEKLQMAVAESWRVLRATSGKTDARFVSITFVAERRAQLEFAARQAGWAAACEEESWEFGAANRKFIVVTCTHLGKGLPSMPAR